jgi:hypothetical protein
MLIRCSLIFSGHVQEEGKGQEQGGQQAGLLRPVHPEAAAPQGHPPQHRPHRRRGLLSHHIPSKQREVHSVETQTSK